MIEVFKTNVRLDAEARKLVNIILRQLPGCRVNIDLHDCDKVLRIEDEMISVKQVMQLVSENGFLCEILE